MPARPNETCTVNYIDHVGVAVKDIYAALKLLQRVFDAPTARVEELAEQGVRAALIQVGQTRLELLEPLSEDSAVGRFIQRRGEGLHHLALNVDDIAGKLEILDGLGLRLIDREPRAGLSGTIAFVHPGSVFGVLTELVEVNRTNPSPESDPA
jgi:methylmalonyl-CoA epimerase